MAPVPRGQLRAWTIVEIGPVGTGSRRQQLPKRLLDQQITMKLNLIGSSVELFSLRKNRGAWPQLFIQRAPTRSCESDKFNDLIPFVGAFALLPSKFSTRTPLKHLIQPRLNTGAIFWSQLCASSLDSNSAASIRSMVGSPFPALRSSSSSISRTKVIRCR